MKRLYNIIFPIWLLLLVPPIVLIVMPSNFIIDSIVLIIGLKLLKITNPFDKYKKAIIKVWIIGFIVDILGSLLLLLTQFISSNEYLYEKLVYPLVWNPFESILALIYILIVVIICGFLIYLINYKFSFKKTDLKINEKRFVSILLGIITAPYLFFFPTSILYSEPNYLEKLENTSITETKKIKKILSYTYSSENLENFKIKGSTIIINLEESMLYQNMEQDALILFNLIDDLRKVEFKENKIYTFDFNYIKSINPFIKNIDRNEIYSRYENEYFSKFTYLGHVPGFGFDIFDTSTSCGNDKNEIYRDNEYIYYIECSDIDALYLVDDNQKIKVKTALEKEIIYIEHLFQTNLKISKEVKSEINS